MIIYAVIQKPREYDTPSYEAFYFNREKANNHALSANKLIRTTFPNIEEDWYFVVPIAVEE